MTWLAIVAIHTAANEPPKVRQVMNKIHRNVAVHDHLVRRGLEVRHLEPADRRLVVAVVLLVDAEPTLPAQLPEKALLRAFRQPPGLAGLKDSIGERSNNSNLRHQNSVEILPEFEKIC